MTRDELYDYIASGLRHMFENDSCAVLGTSKDPAQLIRMGRQNAHDPTTGFEIKLRDPLPHSYVEGK